MKNLGIYVNKNKDKTLEITGRIVECAKKYEFTYEIYGDTKLLDNHEVTRKTEEFVCGKDAVIVLGGDGTILRIASAAAKASVPLLSVNLGHLGFLTELELDELEEGLKKLAAGDFYIEERMMLECLCKGKSFLALNDVCLQRSKKTKLLKFKAYAGEDCVDALSADGVLVSSPTGSTAYSLSAGGPIISPRLSLLLMTPICAHTLRARPFVFKDDEKLHFVTTDACGFSVICDGVNLPTIEGASEVEVFRSKASLKLIKFKQVNFFKRLNSKFNEWNFNKECE